MRRRTQADIRVYSRDDRPTFWFILAWSIDLIAFVLQLMRGSLLQAYPARLIMMKGQPQLIVKLGQSSRWKKGSMQDIRALQTISMQLSSNM
ncbi:hypothetical protein ACFX2B_023733 [Malus domestica]